MPELSRPTEGATDPSHRGIVFGASEGSRGDPEAASIAPHPLPPKAAMGRTQDAEKGGETDG